MDIPMSEPVVKNHISLQMTENTMQHGELRAHHCSGIINRTSQLGYDQHRYRWTQRDSTPSPVTTRSRSTRSRARKDLLHDPTETENKHQNGDTDAARDTPSNDLPEWLEEFTENLEYTEGSALSNAPTSMSREPRHQGSSRKVVSGQHSTVTHFPKDRNCDMCMKTKLTRARCRKRTGAATPRGDLITADHKVSPLIVFTSEIRQPGFSSQPISRCLFKFSMFSVTFHGSRCKSQDSTTTEGMTYPVPSDTTHRTANPRTGARRGRSTFARETLSLFNLSGWRFSCMRETTRPVSLTAVPTNEHVLECGQ